MQELQKRLTGRGVGTRTTQKCGPRMGKDTLERIRDPALDMQTRMGRDSKHCPGAPSEQGALHLLFYLFLASPFTSDKTEAKQGSSQTARLGIPPLASRPGP